MGLVQVNFKYGINENLAGGKLDLGSEGQGDGGRRNQRLRGPGRSMSPSALVEMMCWFVWPAGR